MRARSWMGPLAIVMFGAVSAADAGVPPYLTEQGRLFDSANHPVEGPTQFVFGLYEEPSGGSAVWTETQTIVLDSGLFSAKLGVVTAIPPGTFAQAANAGTTLYLGIRVNSDEELSPRQPVL